MNRYEYDRMIKEEGLTRNDGGMLVDGVGCCINPYIYEWSDDGVSWHTQIGVELTEEGAKKHLVELHQQGEHRYYRTYRTNELDELIEIIEL